MPVSEFLPALRSASSVSYAFTFNAMSGFLVQPLCTPCRLAPRQCSSSTSTTERMSCATGEAR